MLENNNNPISSCDVLENVMCLMPISSRFGETHKQVAFRKKKKKKKKKKKTFSPQMFASLTVHIILRRKINATVPKITAFPKFETKAQKPLYILLESPIMHKQ